MGSISCELWNVTIFNFTNRANCKIKFGIPHLFILHNFLNYHSFGYSKPFIALLYILAHIFYSNITHTYNDSFVWHHYYCELGTIIIMVQYKIDLHELPDIIAYILMHAICLDLDFPACTMITTCISQTGTCMHEWQLQ